MKKILFGQIVALALLLTACPTKITGINATATPSTVTSGGSSSLNAVVSGIGGFDQSVTWSIVAGGGTLSVTSGSSVTLTAPTVTSQASIQVKATAAGDSSISQTLSLTVTISGTNNSIFTDSNAWHGTIPSNAEQVSPVEFQRRIDSGETVLTSDTSIAAQQAAREKQYQDDKSFLQGIPDKSPAIQALLDVAAAKPKYEGDVQSTLSNGQTVMLLGTGIQLRDAVEAYKLSRSVDNALDNYTQAYAFLSDTLKPQAISPDTLKGKSLAEINAAMQLLDGLLGTQLETTQTVRLEPTSIAPLHHAGITTRDTLNSGNGTDQDVPCSAPTNYVAKYWFPLKNFISPIKNQANRGTCWAFAAIGAVESRELVQNNNATNLSEQFLINKVKHDWDNSDSVDGYFSNLALNSASSRGQSLLSESGWTYNPASNGIAHKDNDISTYNQDCDNYSGTCSHSSHESHQVCTKVVFVDFCSYSEVVFNGPGVTASSTQQVWSNGYPFNLNILKANLANGYVLLANFVIYSGFDGAVNGVVSDFSTTGNRGGHAVQIVGFLPNEKLQPNPKAGGGGYFIIKNSWGCGAGDGGFYYIPASYVSTLFNSISVLNFDSRRSEVWKQDQSAPQISFKSNPFTAGLGASTDLALDFTVSHPVSSVNSVNLTVTSDKDGTLYNGSWSVNGLFSASLKHTFTTLGDHILTFVAQYNGNSTKTTLNVKVENIPPTLKLLYNGIPQQNAIFPITASVSDLVDGSESPLLCNNTFWQVDLPDTLSANSGCNVTVTFGNTGSRQVRVSTTNSRGATTSQMVNLDVAPSPANPYPKLKSLGVFSTQKSNLNVCSDTAVASGSIINLTQLSCFLIGSFPRYHATVEVDNPTNETLSYDWTLYIGNSVVYDQQLASSSNDYALASKYRNGQTTTPCFVTVAVNAPETSRNIKSQIAWTGTCILNTFNLN